MVLTAQICSFILHSASSLLLPLCVEQTLLGCCGSSWWELWSASLVFLCLSSLEPPSTPSSFPCTSKVCCLTAWRRMVGSIYAQAVFSYLCENHWVPHTCTQGYLVASFPGFPGFSAATPKKLGSLETRLGILYSGVSFERGPLCTQSQVCIHAAVGRSVCRASPVHPAIT